MGAETTLLVCVTCRRASPGAAGRDAPESKAPATRAPAVPGQARDSGELGAAACPGAALFEALAAARLPEGMRLKPVECLSACSNGCAIALAGPGRWTYVYGNLDPAGHPAEILAGAAAYAATPDGLVPWRERPLVFRRNSIARVPPLEMDPA